MMMGTNDFSGDESRKMTRHDIIGEGELSPAGYEDKLGPYDTHDLHGAVQYDAGREFNEHE